MKEYKALNRIVLDAVSELKFIFEIKNPNDYFVMDKFFLRCEKKLRGFKAPEREINLRLFALAVHCDRNYPREFFDSTVFARYSSALDFSYFEQVSKMLIEENSFALVIFFMVLRCSIAGSLPHKDYLLLETEMKRALLA